MKHSTKVWLIVAAALVVTGTILIGGVMTLNRWDLSVLEGAQIEGVTVQIREDFDSISILSSTEDIVILPSEDGECKVVFDSPMTRDPVASVKDGILVIETVNPANIKNWIEDISFLSVAIPRIIVYLPKQKYESISISESTGNVHIEKLSFIDCRITNTTGYVFLDSIACDGNMDLSTNTGDTELSYVTCSSLNSKGSTGDIVLKHVLAEESITVLRGTGNVTLDLCDAGALDISTSTGDVTGTLLSNKLFTVKTSTGDVRVPETTSGGSCKITTSTGDITLNVQTQH